MAAWEHVIPETLGNAELVLPAGVVCDRCNNGPLAALDEALCGFHPYKAFRTLHGVPTKAGRPPLTKFPRGWMQRVDDVVRVVLNESDKGRTVREVGRNGDKVNLRVDLSGGPRLTDKTLAKLSRALLKSAFEAAWLDHGPKLLQARYDPIRSAVRGAPRHGYMLLQRAGFEACALASLTYEFRDAETESEIVVAFDYFGVRIATDSRDAPLEAEQLEYYTRLMFDA